ncbi:MAG: AMP-binding protein [Deltaproteobacteria bacterium]|nr:AMP-binding protein [Deltaproteobacteria bacterium]
MPSSQVPADFLDGVETVTAAIAELVTRFPEHECLIVLDRHWNDERTTLASFWKRAKSFQAAVESRGLGVGDSAVVILPNGSDLVACYFGVMLAGGVPALAAIPSNRVADHRAYLRLVRSVLANAQAKVVCCDDAVAELLEASDPPILSDTELLRRGDVPASAVSSEATLETATPSPDDVATIQYSSGTTGDPKGVMLSHRAMLNYMRLLRDGAELSTDDVHVNWAPLYHDMGLFGAFLLPLLCGCSTVLIPTMEFIAAPSLWLRAIDRYRGTVSWAPNFAYSLCAKRIDDKEIEGLDLSSWRIAFNASEPCLPASVEAFAERFGPYGYRPEAMTSAWGLAETVMVGTIHPVDEAPLIDVVDRRLLATESRAEPTDGDGVALMATGRPLPNVEIEIRELGNGARLPDRRVGEIWLRSNCLFEGYRADPKLTAEVVVDGWLNSGDRGYTVDGHLFFVARVKDLIVIGGEKYMPHDIESMINVVPGVREGCAVAFGVMNESLGTEVVGAVVETRVEGGKELTALSRAIRREVSRTTGLGIRLLHLVAPGGISKTTSGKLARRATRARYPEVFGAP